MAGLSKLAVVKLALALAGILAFGAGVRFSDVRIRWVGIALVALAWVLRFAGPRGSGGRGAPPADAQLPDDTR